MATRSSIAMLNLNGTVKSIYCHNSGYISHNGQMLYEHYKNKNKIKELLSFGDMSSLAEEVSLLPGVEDGIVCYFYGRDRGEPEDDVKAAEHDSLELYMQNGNFQEYDYVFKEKNETWYVVNHKTKKLQKLTTLLMKDEEVSEHVKQMINTEKLAKQLKKELPLKLDVKKELPKL
jgi:hypothetical protein